MSLLAAGMARQADTASSAQTVVTGDKRLALQLLRLSCIRPVCMAVVCIEVVCHPSYANRMCRPCIGRQGLGKMPRNGRYAVILRMQMACRYPTRVREQFGSSFRSILWQAELGNSKGRSRGRRHRVCRCFSSPATIFTGVAPREALVDSRLIYVGAGRPTGPAMPPGRWLCLGGACASPFAPHL